LKFSKGRRALARLAILAGLFAVPSGARAASPQTIDVHVSINASKSLSVNATSYNYGALGVDVSSVSSAVTVTNDSTALIETYRIQGSSAVSNTAGTDWVLASSTGTDQYALAAIFQNAQPSNTDSAFSSDDTTYSPITCTATQFGNGNGNEAGINVNPVVNTTRNLWFRIRTPNVVTDPSAHTVTITLSVL
jgi:hypothetical protein